MTQTPKSPLESAMNKLLQTAVHNAHNIEAARKILNLEELTPEVKRLLEIAQLRQQAGEATDTFGFHLARVLEEVLDNILRTEHLSSRLPEILIRDQYLTPIDKKRSVKEVHAHLQDADYLQQMYSLDEDTARKTVSDAQFSPESATYNRRRKEGVAFLAWAVQRFVAKQDEKSSEVNVAPPETKIENNAPPVISVQKPVPWPVALLPVNIFSRQQMASVVERLTLTVPGEPMPRIIVLAGPPGSGKTTLINTVILNPIIQGHFEGGCVVLREDVDHRQWIKFLGQQAPRSSSRDNVQLAWQSWIRGKRMKLVILDGLEDWRIVKEILKYGGDQVRILVAGRQGKTPEAQKMWERLNEIRTISINDISRQKRVKFGSLWSSYYQNKHIEPISPLNMLSMYINLSVGAQIIHIAPKSKSIQEKVFEIGWEKLPKTEKDRLSKLLESVSANGNFSKLYASLLWNEEDEKAQERLSELARQGWLEQVVEVGWRNENLAEERVKRYRFAYGAQKFLATKLSTNILKKRWIRYKLFKSLRKMWSELVEKGKTQRSQPEWLWNRVGLFQPGQEDLARWKARIEQAVKTRRLDLSKNALVGFATVVGVGVTGAVVTAGAPLIENAALATGAATVLPATTYIVFNTQEDEVDDLQRFALVWEERGLAAPEEIRILDGMPSPVWGRALGALVAAPIMALLTQPRFSLQFPDEMSWRIEY